MAIGSFCPFEACDHVGMLPRGVAETPSDAQLSNPDSRLTTHAVEAKHATHDSRQRRNAYLAWITVCLVWGTTYLAIRIALESIPPLLMAAMRYTTAGTLLAAMLRARGERLPGVRAWPSLFVLGVLLLGFGNGGVVWAEQTVPSGLTAVLVATSPFWITGIDVTLGGEALTRRRWLGLLIGFVGIVGLVWNDLQLGDRRAFLVGVIAAQIACVGWAVGSLYARRRGHSDAREENVLATAAFEMLFGGLALFGAAAVHHEYGSLTFSARSTAALAYLIVFGAVVGFTAYAYALKHLPVATVSLYAYINPVIAVFLGVLILNEPFGMRDIIAATVVFGGVALVRSR
jgi:drug/metabolite transporter (DMT)-like permease